MGGFMYPGLYPAAVSPPLKPRSHTFEPKALAFSSRDLGLFTSL